MTHIINRPDPEKPTSKDLLHYGVKGMRWGIRRSDEELRSSRTSRNSDNKDRTRKAKIFSYEESVVEKFNSNESGSRLSSEQKRKIAIAAASGVAILGVAGVAYYYKKNDGDFSGLRDFESSLKASRERAIQQDFLTDLSYSRSGFTIPAGQTFYRVSSGSETSFSQVTYASASMDDFRRYASHLGPTLSTKVTFKSKTSIKVPTLNETLDILGRSSGRDKESTLSLYKSIIGGTWDSPEAISFISELKKSGFSAIIDDNDHGIISENPLILLDSSQFSPKRSSRLSLSDYRKIAREVKDFAERK